MASKTNNKDKTEWKEAIKNKMKHRQTISNIGELASKTNNKDKIEWKEAIKNKMKHSRYIDKQFQIWGISI